MDLMVHSMSAVSQNKHGEGVLARPSVPLHDIQDFRGSDIYSDLPS